MTRHEASNEANPVTVGISSKDFKKHETAVECHQKVDADLCSQMKANCPSQ